MQPSGTVPQGPNLPTEYPKWVNGVVVNNAEEEKAQKSQPQAIDEPAVKSKKAS